MEAKKTGRKPKHATQDLGHPEALHGLEYCANKCIAGPLPALLLLKSNEYRSNTRSLANYRKTFLSPRRCIPPVVLPLRLAVFDRLRLALLCDTLVRLFPALLRAGPAALLEAKSCSGPC